MAECLAAKDRRPQGRWQDPAEDDLRGGVIGSEYEMVAWQRTGFGNRLRNLEYGSRIVL